MCDIIFLIFRLRLNPLLVEVLGSKGLKNGCARTVYEIVTFRQTSVTLPELIEPPPPVPAQSGKLCKSNIGTPYKLTQITNTVTARIFIPKPTFAWEKKNKEKYLKQALKRITQGRIRKLTRVVRAETTTRSSLTVTLMRSCGISCALVEFEPAQIFVRIDERFRLFDRQIISTLPYWQLVWPCADMMVDVNSRPTLVNSRPTLVQLSSNSRPTLVQLSSNSRPTFVNSRPTNFRQLSSNSRPTLVQLLSNSRSTLVQLSSTLISLNSRRLSFSFDLNRRS